MNTRFTSGPWVSVDNGCRVIAPEQPEKIFGEQGQYKRPFIVTQPGLYTDVQLNTEELLANCNLMAAAPDLLAACEQARSALLELIGADYDLANDLVVLNAAILKAKGVAQPAPSADGAMTNDER